MWQQLATKLSKINLRYAVRCDLFRTEIVHSNGATTLGVEHELEVVSSCRRLRALVRIVLSVSIRNVLLVFHPGKRNESLISFERTSNV